MSSPSQALHLLVFAHRTGAYDLYERAALLLIDHSITLEPAWAREPVSSYCDQRHRPRDHHLGYGFGRPPCYDSRHCIKQLPSYSHPDDKPDVERSSTVASAFYRCPDDDSDELMWGWFEDHFDGIVDNMFISAPAAVELLATALELNIDVSFFPGALAAVVMNDEVLTPTAIASLTQGEEGNPVTIADWVMTRRDVLAGDAVGPDSAQAHIGKGVQLVNRLHRAKRLWAYCTRLKDEATWGMANAVIRTVWDAP